MGYLTQLSKLLLKITPTKRKDLETISRSQIIKSLIQNKSIVCEATLTERLSSVLFTAAIQTQLSGAYKPITPEPSVYTSLQVVVF